MLQLALVLLVFWSTLTSAAPAPLAASQMISPTDTIDGGVSLAKRNATETLEKREGPGLYVCQNVGFKEPCMYVPHHEFTPQPNGLGLCYKAEGIFYDSISSIGPDRGLTCVGHFRGDCEFTKSPDFGPIRYPGVQKVAQFQQSDINYHDRINSVTCWEY